MAKEPKKIWDNYKVMGSVLKSDALKFEIAAAYRDGVKYINVREFYKRKKDDTWMPGRDGITIPIVIPINNARTKVKTYEGFIELLDKAFIEFDSMPLEDEENAVWYTPKGGK